MSPDAELALRRLLHIASGDTGQSRRVANFLLAWWNAADLGGFDLTDLWNVDRAIGEDMVIVFNWLATSGQQQYPDRYKDQFEQLVRLWRSKILA